MLTNNDTKINYKKPIKIIIAGGGTGGHIFPGIALADQFIKDNSKTEIMFVGTGMPLEKKILKNTRYHHRNLPIKIKDFKNKKIKSAIQILKSILKAKNIIDNFSPQLVISVGGYSAGPIGIIAKIKKIPLVVCEQNILPGLTNKLLFKISDKIYSSFRETIGLKNTRKVIFYGNPLRHQLISKFKQLESSTIREKRKFTIFIVGGSQGANAINIAVIDALQYIEKINTLHFIHQSGLEDEEKIKQTYMSKKIDATVKNFFNDIWTYYEQADIVICRAGATTLAELTALGKCSIIIPYPFASNNHQLLNALSLVSVGAATMILEKNLNGIRLAQHINSFINNSQKINSIALKARTVGMRKASELITADIYKTLKQKKCT